VTWVAGQGVGSAEGPTRAPIPAAAQAAHDEAVSVGASTYIDPGSGYSVLTEETLRARQICCGNGCRHCPYGEVDRTGPSRRSGG
jgi:hypothetical protein